MTSTIIYSETKRNIQDGSERHVYGDMEYVPGAGSVVKVRGNGSEDDEVPTMVTGYGFRLPKDTDAEVLVFASGGDVNNKVALLTIPHDKQREWKEGRGGIQNPMDPTHALEFKDGNLHLTKGTFSTGDGGTIEVKDGQIIIRGNVVVTGQMTVNGGIITPSVSPGNDPNVPAFTAS